VRESTFPGILASGANELGYEHPPAAEAEHEGNSRGERVHFAESQNDVGAPIERSPRRANRPVAADSASMGAREKDIGKDRGLYDRCT